MAGLVALEAQLPTSGSWEDASGKNPSPLAGRDSARRRLPPSAPLICLLGARLAPGTGRGLLPSSVEPGRVAAPELVLPGSRGRHRSRAGRRVYAPAGSPQPAPLVGGRGVLSLVLGLQGGGGSAPHLGSSLGCGWLDGWGSPLSFLFSLHREPGSRAAGGGLVLPGRELPGLIPTLCRGPGCHLPL